MKFLFIRKIYQKIHKKAFSLIELSIVIVIISILLSGALSIVASTTNSSKIKATNNNINEVYNALKVYLLANNRLPCPAPITAIKSTSDSYGAVTAMSGDCSADGVYTSVDNANLVYGMVPVKDLGLSGDMAEDAFGNKLAYVVDKRFTDDVTFGNDNADRITIMETTSAMVGGSKVTQTHTDLAIFVIISYGANKSGAFGVNAATQNSESSDEEESSNYAVPIDATTATLQDTFYFHSGTSDVFDDIIFYKTRDMLVTEAGAFNLIPCPALSDSDVKYDGTDDGIVNPTTMTWDAGGYGQVVAATTDCPDGYQETVAKPTKRCNALGNWQPGVVDPCTYTATTVATDLSCTGVTPTTSGGNTIHTFTSNGSLVCTGSGFLTYLVVGGGGGGGGANTDGGGGGGGGGGVATYTNYPITGDTTIAITVGNGGAAGVSGTSATNGGTGETSSLGSIESATGGVGGNRGGNNDGAGGASGSGDSSARAGGGAGTCDNGHGAGGGGSSMANAGATGSLVYHTHSAGNGGAGTSSSITGTSLSYGSGGGGSGGGGTSEGAKGNGGGTDGGYGQTNGTAASAGVTNRGGGGGGGGKNASTARAGGKGVVIVSYPTPTP